MPPGMHGNHARGERASGAKLSVWDVAAIRALFAGEQPPTVYGVAKAYGISRRQVRRIRDGQHWRD